MENLDLLKFLAKKYSCTLKLSTNFKLKSL